MGQFFGRGCDEAAELRIFGLHSHPATAKFFEDAVMRDRLPND
jgi:hypothetical protein